MNRRRGVGASPFRASGWTGRLCCLCACGAAFFAAQGARSGESPAFENPPLLYAGPDPTANSFLPAAWLRPDSEIVPLPPVEGAETVPVMPGHSPSDMPVPPAQTAPPIVVPPEFVAPPELVLPPDFDVPTMVEEGPQLQDFKNGFYQRAGVTATWLARGSSAEGLGLTELDSFVMVAVPAPSREWPLVISPTFNVRFLDGASSLELPETLYETYLDLLWLPRLSSRWTGILSVAPSLYTDFEVDTQEAWRLTGRALARFDWVPDRLQLLFGVLYLDRQDVRVLPAGGLIWTPSPDRHYELVFPRPKLAHRIQWGARHEDWLYLGSEFGGNSFAFARDDEVDTITLRDYRVYLGLERKFDGGAGYRLEVGYVFSREAEFASGAPDISSPGTAHLRIGATY